VSHTAEEKTHSEESLKRKEEKKNPGQQNSALWLLNAINLPFTPLCYRRQ
jgi:hypothetical protein